MPFQWHYTCLVLFSCFPLILNQSVSFRIFFFYHRVDFVALQLRSETIISSSLRYFPAGSCQIKWNKTLSVYLGRWQYYRLSFNILTSQMITNLSQHKKSQQLHDIRHFDSPRIPLQPLTSFQATVEHVASNHVIKTIRRI